MRIRVFLLALVGMPLVCLSLFAADQTPFSVGIVALQDDASSLLAMVEEAGTTYASTFIPANEAYKEYLTFRDQAEAEVARLKNISFAYVSKSEKELEKALQPMVLPQVFAADRLSVSYSQVSLEPGYSNLLDTFAESRPWYASRENLDALLLVKQTRLASKERIRIYWYDLFSDTTTLIFDQLDVGESPSSMLEEIGEALLAKCAGPDYGLLLFDSYSSLFVVEANGEPLVIEDKKVLLPSGEYSLSISSEGYVSKQIPINVLPNTITHVPISLKRIQMGDMRLSSPLGKVSWFVDGLYYGEGCDLSISASMAPLVVVAKKDGFASKTLQIQKPIREIVVPLEPEWMKDSLLLEDRQRGFYKSLRNTMLVFGLYVASTTLSQTFEVASPLWQPLQVATSGFALVSTLHTIMNLASYVALASSGVR